MYLLLLYFLNCSRFLPILTFVLRSLFWLTALELWVNTAIQWHIWVIQQLSINLHSDLLITSAEHVFEQQSRDSVRTYRREDVLVERLPNLHIHGKQVWFQMWNVNFLHVFCCWNSTPLRPPEGWVKAAGLQAMNTTSFTAAGPSWLGGYSILHGFHSQSPLTLA